MCVQSGPSDRVLIAVGGALANVGLVTDDEQSVPLLSQREVGPVLIFWSLLRRYIHVCKSESDQMHVSEFEDNVVKGLLPPLAFEWEIVIMI